MTEKQLQQIFFEAQLALFVFCSFPEKNQKGTLCEALRILLRLVLFPKRTKRGRSAGHCAYP
jgi:hypothetical protein